MLNDTANDFKNRLLRALVAHPRERSWQTLVTVVSRVGSHYTGTVKVQYWHSWKVTVEQAREIQRRLAAEVSSRNRIQTPHLIAGADISSSNQSRVGRGAVVVLNFPELVVEETVVVEGELYFPYIPGMLSFREAPLVLTACQKLSAVPDFILVDGQGLAHPRRLGLASHLGLLLDIPAIGCAKSILCGRHGPLGVEVGCYSDLVDGGEVIGAAVRTRERAKPVYVSIGHAVDLPNAIHWVMQCCRGYRVPEPTRLAHLAAGGSLKLKKGYLPEGSPNKGQPGRLFP